MKKDLYVVGLIPEPVKSHIFEYQKKLSALYELYDKKYPELHVTLARLNYENIHEVTRFSAVLGNILPAMEPQTVEIQGIHCFGPPFKSVSLHVKTTPGLKNLSDTIISAGKQEGLSCEYPFETWEYHITIASPTFAKREWLESEYQQACILLKSLNINESFLMDHIQLWHPVMEDYAVNTYILNKKSCT